MIAYCGLDCTKCGAFKATATNDDALRAKTAEEWSKSFNAEIAPESINCTGCTSDGIKFHYCENMCEIRKCARERALSTCADCPDYSCGRLETMYKMAPETKKALEALRQGKH